MTDAAVATASAASSAALAKLVEAQAAAQYTLLLRVFMLLSFLWSRPGAVTDQHIAASTVARTIVVMQQAQTAARELEKAYVQSYARQMGVEYERDELVTRPYWPRSVDPVTEMNRVLEEYRYNAYGKGDDLDFTDLEDDRPYSDALVIPDADPIDTDFDKIVGDLDYPDDVDEDALAAALRRLYRIVDTDLQRARDDEHGQMLEKKKVWLGYRRVIHPELSKTGTCGLCVVAATRLYGVKELAPLHRLCKCTQIGVTAEMDPAAAMNREDFENLFVGLAPNEGDVETIQAGRVEFTREMLDEIYEAAGSTYGVDLKDVRIHTIQHGELGPMLSWYQEKGRNKKGAMEYRRPNAEDTRAGWQTTLKWAERRRDQMLQAITQLGDDDGMYTQAASDFDAVIERMRGLLAQPL